MKSLDAMSFSETLVDIPNRLVTLVWKLLSIKAIGFFAVAFLIYKGTLNGWEAVVALIFALLLWIGGREADKWKKTFIELKTGSLIGTEKEDKDA